MPPATTTTVALVEPAAPAINSAVAGDGEVTISWSAPSDGGSAISGYTVQYSTSSSFASPSTADVSASPRQVTISSLSNGSSYYFRVLARNSVGSGPYSVSSGAVSPATSPGIPSNLQASESDSALTLSWSAPSSGGSAIIDYIVQYSTSEVFSIYQSVTVGDGATSTSLTGLANGNTYYFKVKARNAIASGANSGSSAGYVPRASRTLSIDSSSYSATYLMTSTPPTITATASAGSGVKSYSSSTPSICTVGSSSGVIAFVSAGTCSISASVAQSGAYLAADSSPISFTIGVGTQTVSWSPTTAVLTTQSPLTPSASATTSGDGALSYAVTSAGTTGCSVNASSGVLSYTAAGSCVVRATAAATARYSAATVDVTFVVSRVSRTVTIDSASHSASYAMTVTAPTLSSTLSAGSDARTYTSSDTAVCTVNSSTGAVAFVATGTCSMTAAVAETSVYNSATSAAVSFTLTRATQTVSWSPTTAVLTTQSPLTPSASATTSGDGAISYAVTSAGTTGCLVNASSGVLSYTAAGSCVVRATAAVTARYSAATADVTLVVSKVTPTLTSMSNIAKSDSDPSFTPSAPSASYGGTSVPGTLSYSSATTSVATVNSATGAVAIVGVGTSVITASFTPTNTSVYNVTTRTYTVSVTDQTAPTVSVSRSGSGTLLVGQTASLTFTLSESSTNFVVGDVTVSGGSLSSFGGSGVSHTATFTPTSGSSGTASVLVGAGVLSDAAGNGNTASSALSIGYDTLAPTVSVTAATISSSGSATVISSESGTVYLVSSSVSVTGIASITSANGSLWNSVVVPANAGTSLSATGLSDGTYYAYAADLAGNLSTQSVNYLTVRTVSCANGGVCSLGEIGPGGGMVFYVSASGFTCGLNNDQTCNYLEVAPRDWYLTTCGAPDMDCKSQWQTSGSTSLIGTATTFGRSLFNAGLIETALGTCSSPVSSCNASGKARQYRGGSKSDWTLPTSGDLDKIIAVYSSHVANCVTNNSSCYSFERDVYLTSSESSATAVYSVQLTKSGWAYNSGFSKTNIAMGRVRPVRSFAPIP